MVRLPVSSLVGRVHGLGDALARQASGDGTDHRACHDAHGSGHRADGSTRRACARRADTRAVKARERVDALEFQITVRRAWQIGRS